MPLDFDKLLPPATLSDPGRAAAALPGAALLRINFVPGLRQRLNWRGMRECPRFPESLTARVAGRPGVYGLTCLSGSVADGLGRAEFALNYFPAAEDEPLDGFSVEACLSVLADGYIERVRDFPAFPEMCGLFHIANLEFILDSGRGAALVVDAAERAIIVARDGVVVDTPKGPQQAVPPGGRDKDITAFALAAPFVEALAASIGQALGASPSRLSRHSAPGQAWTYDASGQVDTEPCDDARDARLALGWGAAPAAFDAPAAIEVDWTSPAPIPREYADAVWWRISEADARHSLDKTALGVTDLPKLIVLTGFLGSGKTSFLSRFIEYQASRNGFVAVIQNEIGEKGLDGRLLGQHYAVAEVDEGCVCCTLAGSLKAALSGILHDYQPDYVVLETTGLANPANLLGEIADLEEHLVFSSITTLVDARLGVETLARYAVARDQVRLADAVLLNKVADAPDESVRTAEAAIRDLNPTAAIHRIDHGDISPAMIYGVNTAAQRQPDAPAHVCCGGHDHHHDHGHDHECRCHPHDEYCPDCGDRTHPAGHTHLEDGLSSRLWSIPAPLDGDALRSALSSLPPSVLRVKGVVDIAGEGTPCVCQHVPGSFRLTPTMDENVRASGRYLVLIGEDIETATRAFISAVDPTPKAAHSAE